jgi:hypothetical protein
LVLLAHLSIVWLDGSVLVDGGVYGSEAMGFASPLL